MDLEKSLPIIRGSETSPHDQFTEVTEIAAPVISILQSGMDFKAAAALVSYIRRMKEQFNKERVLSFHCVCTRSDKEDISLLSGAEFR